MKAGKGGKYKLEEGIKEVGKRGKIDTRRREGRKLEEGMREGNMGHMLKEERQEGRRDMGWRDGSRKGRRGRKLDGGQRKKGMRGMG